MHQVARLVEPMIVGEIMAATLRCAGQSMSGAVEPTRVYARGKHLFIDLKTGLSIRTHLGMYGSWHRYRPGETWQRPAHRASVVLEGDRETVVCFDAREVELVGQGGVRRRRLDARIGLDLIDAPAEAIRELPARVRSACPAGTPLVDVLLDQRIASGVGNVYKSELLFLQGLAPGRTLGATDDAALTEMYRTAGELLRHNVGPGRRVTRLERDGRGTAWVYGRGAHPCLRCGEPIRRDLMGRHRRSTYWCPACQT